MRAWRSWGVVAGATALAACGIDVLGTAPGDGGIGGRDATADVNDATSDVAIDVALDVVSADVAIHDAGIDSFVAPDCAVACADVPSGWSPIYFAPGAAAAQVAACPGGDSPSTVAAVTTAPSDTCACTCGGLDASCTSGTIAQMIPDDSGAGCNVARSSVSTNNGACVTEQSHYHDLLVVEIQPVPITPSGATCPSNVTGLPAAVTATPGVTCAATACTSGSCIEAPAAPLRACILTSGDASCPARGETAYLVSPSGSAGIHDGRTCGACTCSPSSSCLNAELLLFGDGNCTQQILTEPANGTCAEEMGAAGYVSSYQYKATLPGCTPALNAPSGTLSIDDVETICCP